MKASFWRKFRRTLERRNNGTLKWEFLSWPVGDE